MDNIRAITQTAIPNKLDILEIGSHPEPLSSVVPSTVSFHTAAKKPAITVKSKPRCYIPHYTVEKDSATTHICIVFDCSYHQSSKHPSLNDCLVIGSPCNNNLCILPVHFRSHSFGLSKDIEKAFLHLRLHPQDRNYTHFFWLTDSTDPSSPLCVYCLTVMPFGATSSPFMLNAILQYHLKQYNTPVSNDMLSNLYG